MSNPVTNQPVSITPRRPREAATTPASRSPKKASPPDNVSVKLTGRDLEIARDLGARHGGMKEGDVVRQAVRMMFLIDKEQRAGGTFRLQDAGVPTNDAERVKFRVNPYALTD